MIADRWIDTHTAGQTRISEAIAHEDDIAHRGDEMRDRRDVERLEK